MIGQIKSRVGLCRAWVAHHDAIAAALNQSLDCPFGRRRRVLHEVVGANEYVAVLVRSQTARRQFCHLRLDAAEYLYRIKRLIGCFHESCVAHGHEIP